jgi:hypothetical protein
MQLRSGAGAALMPDMQQGFIAREGCADLVNVSACHIPCRVALAAAFARRELRFYRSMESFADLVNSSTSEVPCRFDLTLALPSCQTCAAVLLVDLVNSTSCEFHAVSLWLWLVRVLGVQRGSMAPVSLLPFSSTRAPAIACRLALALRLLSCQSCSAVLSLE